MPEQPALYDIDKMRTKTTFVSGPSRRICGRYCSLAAYFVVSQKIVINKCPKTCLIFHLLLDTLISNCSNPIRNLLTARRLSFYLCPTSQPAQVPLHAPRAGRRDCFGHPAPGVFSDFKRSPPENAGGWRVRQFSE
ncbi:MAG TPA: hypothetical protein VFS10_09835 [Pyrinomonadaceae bacterium]|nr:hypothetical protein [Pyrinomonadaceae bacterium]